MATSASVPSVAFCANQPCARLMTSSVGGACSPSRKSAVKPRPQAADTTSAGAGARRLAGAVTTRSKGTSTAGADMRPTPTKPKVKTKNQRALRPGLVVPGKLGSAGPKETPSSCAKTVVKYEKPSARQTVMGVLTLIHSGPVEPRGVCRSMPPTRPSSTPTSAATTAVTGAPRPSGGKRLSSENASNTAHPTSSERTKWTSHGCRASASTGPVTSTLASWIELSENAFLTNVASFRAVAGAGRQVGAVLKGNAYGHGLTQTLSVVHGLVDVLYVIRPSEALAIRAWERAHTQPRRDVLVIGAVTPAECVELAHAEVEVVAAGVEFEAVAAALRGAGVRLRVHVHLDTGLGREGFTLSQLERGAADFFSRTTDVLTVVGVLSHFSNTEDVTEQDYARHQLAQFERGSQVLTERLAPATAWQRHFAASAAALVLPPSRLDVLRVGISLYGLWPSTETRLSARVVLGEVPVLEPVLSWRVPSQVVKWVPAGSFIGYGCTFRCSADTRVAVLPVGYWDGYPRLASGKAHVLINGQRCPVLGRVMMNHLIVDVTHAVSSEEPVVATLLGRDGAESVTAETLAAWAQTIHYELVTRLGVHLERRLTP